MVGVGWVYMANKLADSFAWNYANPRLAHFFLYRLQFALTEADLTKTQLRVGISIHQLPPETAKGE